MNTVKEKIEAWVTALRSGEYKQARSRLKSLDGGYCCLGVLEQVLEGAVETHRISGDSLGYPTDEFLIRQGFMAGDDKYSDDAYEVRTYLRELAKKNDNGESFGDIALHIEHTAETVLARLEKNNEHS